MAALLQLNVNKLIGWLNISEVLNHPQPDEPADLPPVPDDLNIDTSPPTEAEVRNAIKAMKSGKAPGVDSIHAEMLKADLSTSIKSPD